MVLDTWSVDIHCDYLIGKLIKFFLSNLKLADDSSNFIKINYNLLNHHYFFAFSATLAAGAATMPSLTSHLKHWSMIPCSLSRSLRTSSSRILFFLYLKCNKFSVFNPGPFAAWPGFGFYCISSLLAPFPSIFLFPFYGPMAFPGCEAEMASSAFIPLFAIFCPLLDIDCPSKLSSRYRL